MIEEVRVVTNVNTEKSHVGPDAPRPGGEHSSPSS